MYYLDQQIRSLEKAIAFVASTSLCCVAPLNSDNCHLHLNAECRGNHDRPTKDTRSIQVMMTEDLTKKVVV
jgi:hypothetical protein